MPAEAGDHRSVILSCLSCVVLGAALVICVVVACCIMESMSFLRLKWIVSRNCAILRIQSWRASGPMSQYASKMLSLYLWALIGSCWSMSGTMRLIATSRGWPRALIVFAVCSGLVRNCDWKMWLRCCVHLEQMMMRCSWYSGWLGELQKGQVCDHVVLSGSGQTPSLASRYAPLKSVILILRSTVKPFEIVGWSFQRSR